MQLDNNFFKDLLLIMCCTPQTPFASFHTTSIAEDLSILHVEDLAPALAAELQCLKDSNFDKGTKDSSNGSLVKCSLLSLTDDFSYTGREFEHRQVNMAELVTCKLVDEVFSLEIQ